MRNLILALTASLFSVSAVQAIEITIEKKEGPQERAEFVSADANGDISYKKERFTLKIKASDYKWARLESKPPDVAAAERKLADKKYAEALEDFKKLYGLYRHVGYDVFCVWKESECLDKLGKKDEAVTRLKTLSAAHIADVKKMPDFFESRKLLATILIDQSKFDESLAVLGELGEADDDNVATFGYNARGEILSKQGKKKDAIIQYMYTAMLFPKENKERPKALCLIANLLKELNDARSVKYADILKKDYPENSHVKELK